MQLGKWGNSLAVRLRAAVAALLDLKAGDEIEPAGDRTLRISRYEERSRAIARLKAMARPLPPGFRFNRDEANKR